MFSCVASLEFQMYDVTQCREEKFVDSELVWTFTAVQFPNLLITNIWAK